MDILNFLENYPEDFPEKIISLFSCIGDISISLEKQDFINFCENKKLKVKKDISYYAIYNNVKFKYENLSFKSFEALCCVERIKKTFEIIKKYNITYTVMSLFDDIIIVLLKENEIQKFKNIEISGNFYEKKFKEILFREKMNEPEIKEIDYLEVLKNERY